MTFGFDTAVAFATEALDRLHTTAESHHRVMGVEVMGRYAGWIALYAGIGGGADVVLIPEIPFDLHKVAERILDRDRLGARFSIIVIAEGAQPAGGTRSVLEIGTPDSAERLGGIAESGLRRARTPDRQGDALRRARPPAARRLAAGLRPCARDAIRGIRGGIVSGCSR